MQQGRDCVRYRRHVVAERRSKCAMTLSEGLIFLWHETGIDRGAPAEDSRF